MPSYFVCAIKFALQLGHDLFCNRRGFCSQLVGLVAISPSKLGHSTLKVVSLHRGSERKTRTKNRNIMIKCKKRMWTTFQSERTLSVCVSLWGFTSTSWAKHSFALSRTCNFFHSSENSCGATHQFQSIPHEIKSDTPTNHSPNLRNIVDMHREKEFLAWQRKNERNGMKWIEMKWKENASYTCIRVGGTSNHSANRNKQILN